MHTWCVYARLVKRCARALTNQDRDRDQDRDPDLTRDCDCDCDCHSDGVKCLYSSMCPHMYVCRYVRMCVCEVYTCIHT
jgi:hypothetical protein